MHRESTVHTLVMKTYTHHNINVGNSVPQLISPLLVEGGPSVGPRPTLLRRRPPNTNKQQRSLEVRKPRTLVEPPIVWHRWDILKLRIRRRSSRARARDH